MRTCKETLKPTYNSIRRNVRFQEIEQRIIERGGLPYAETRDKLLELTKPLMYGGRVFDEEGD